MSPNLFLTPIAPGNHTLITSIPKTANTPQVKWFTMKTLFSDNANVYYKNHSLSSGVIGTVRNSSAKLHKT
jgi:hypothetical protein